MSSQNRFCDRCGKAVPSLDSEFCSFCGSRLTVAMDEPTEEPTSSAPRGAVAGGGRTGTEDPYNRLEQETQAMQLTRIILAVGSLIFPPFGVGVGLWYLLKKKERGFGGLLLGLAIIPLLLVLLLSSDNASDSDDSTGDVSEITSTATLTPAPTATAAPTPAPTATAAPTPTPIVHEFSGTGDSVLGPIMLEPGVLFLVAGHNGQSNFIVQIVGASGSEELSINEIGRYTGIRAHAVSSGSSLFGLVSGTHRIQVQADGPWTLKLMQERPSGGQPPPISDEDNGDGVIRWLNLRKGQYVLTASHDGQSNFIVELLKSDGSQTEYLVNEIGTYSGQAIIQVGSSLFDVKPGLYAFVVQADGHWEFTIE